MGFARIEIDVAQELLSARADPNRKSKPMQRPGIRVII